MGMRREFSVGSSSGGEHAAREASSRNGVARVPAMELLMMVEEGGLSSKKAVQERPGVENDGVTACKQEQRQLVPILVPGSHFSSGCLPSETSSNNVEPQCTLTCPPAATSWLSELMNNSYTYSGFQYHNASSSNLGSFGNIGVDASGGTPNSNGPPLQIGSALPHITSNFYPDSVCQYHSTNVSRLPHCTLFPPPSTGSYMNVFNEHLDAMEAKHQRVTILETSKNLGISNSLLMLFPTSEREDACQEYVGNMNYNTFQSMECNAQNDLQISGQPMICHSLEECDDEANYRGLMMVLQKELSNSDAGSIGRIVLPKREAEANLPPLFERDGIILYMEDMVLQTTWKFKYRFWPNNKSRMYILESTGDFIRAHGLQTGNLFIIYRNAASGKYIVRGKKGTIPPSLDMEHTPCKYEHGPN